MPQPASGGGGRGWLVALGAVGGLLVAGVVVGAFLLGRSNDSDDPAPINASGAPTSSITTAPPPTTAAPPTPIGDVRTQPAGLFCRDLNGRGFSYSAAVDYWRNNGQPDRMDADRNGVPCETVYSRSDVANYWRGRDVATGPGVPSGLLCQDLAARGASYGRAVAYWYTEGLPDRMDADRNGIPCETVYPRSQVDAFWTR